VGGREPPFSVVVRVKIFVLEDDANRVMRLEQELIGHEVTFAKSVATAREAWGKGGFDLALLDHDLGGKTFVDSKEEDTGYRFLEEKVGEMGDTVVVLHSLNPAGAMNMFNLARGKVSAALRVPFGKPLFETLPTLLQVIEEDLATRVGSEESGVVPEQVDC
jgi:hypothetical protein